MPAIKQCVDAVVRLGWWVFARRMWKRVRKDRLNIWASGLAYSYLFALFALLLFLVTVTPYLPFDPNVFLQRIQHALESAMPHEAARTVIHSLNHALRSRHGGILGAGILVAIWTTGRGMATTMSALNHCNGISSDLPFYKQRPLAIVLTLFIATLGLLALLIISLGVTLGDWITNAGIVKAPASQAWIVIATGWVGYFFRKGVELLLMLLAVSVTYHFGPRERRRFQLISPGSAIVVAGWISGGLALNIYINRFGLFSEVYGAVGGLLVVLVVFYWDALVFLFGAEIDDELDRICAE